MEFDVQKTIIIIILMFPVLVKAQSRNCFEIPNDISHRLLSLIPSSSTNDLATMPLSVLENSQTDNQPGRLTGILSHDLFLSDSSTTGSKDSMAILETRSAIKSGLFSLLVPGAGQAYNRNYMKAAGFFTAELSGWIMNAIWNKKGDDETNAFKLYADGTAADGYRDGHYSVVRYASWIQQNLPELMSQQGTSPANQAIANQNAPLMIVSNGGQAPWNQINWVALNNVENAIGGYFSHWLFAYPGVEYYKEIGKYPQFRQGWDDENPAYLDYVSLQTDTPHSFLYEQMRGTATHLYNVALVGAGIIIINHFASAAEAAIWAHNHNKSIQASVGLSLLPQGMGYQSDVSVAVNF